MEFGSTFPPLPSDRPEAGMEDLKPAYSQSQALAEANRCLYCFDAPCVTACPTGIDIPTFIHKIATGNIRGSAQTILESNILGHSCARVCPVEVLCVGACVHNLQEHPPIQIGRLQRYATDWSYARGIQHFHPGEPTGCRVALIGAGPASLACAAELAILGHKAVILEGRELPGGLNSTGVAPYKMKADVALEEVAMIQRLGVEIRTGVQVGRDVSLADLERDYDAIFLGVGLGEDSYLNVEGEDLDGVWGAVELIEHIKLDPKLDLSSVKTALVIGGGNTAIDATRELRRLGISDVKLIYRRDYGAMSAYVHEWDYAKKEGVSAHFHRVPVAFEGEGGRVVRARLAVTEQVGDRVRVVPGVEESLACDLVVLAIGQSKQQEFLASIPSLTLNRGRVEVDGSTHQTSNPRYFAGGDCVNGGKEVVNGAAEGKTAARGIHQFLKSIGRLA